MIDSDIESMMVDVRNKSLTFIIMTEDGKEILPGKIGKVNLHEVDALRGLLELVYLKEGK